MYCCSLASQAAFGGETMARMKVDQNEQQSSLVDIVETY